MSDVKIIAGAEMRGAPLFIGPVEFCLDVTYPWPKSMSAKRRACDGFQWKDTRPDLSNLVKLIEDSLNGVVYCDDGQIARHVTSKTFAERAEVRVTIRELRGVTP